MVQQLNFLDPPLYFASGTHYTITRKSSDSSESCPKIDDVPKSPFPVVAALVPSVGTLTLHQVLRVARMP
jgi:hypothetical protein